MLWLDEFGHGFWYAALQVLLLYIMCPLLHFCGVSYALLRGQLSTKQAFYQHFRKNEEQKRRLSRTFDVYLQNKYSAFACIGDKGNKGDKRR